MNLLIVPLLRRKSLFDLSNTSAHFHSSTIIIMLSTLLLASSALFYYLKIFKEFNSLSISRTLPIINIAIIGSIIYASLFLPENKLLALINLTSFILFELFLLYGVILYITIMSLQFLISLHTKNTAALETELDELLEKLKIIKGFENIITPYNLSFINTSISYLNEKKVKIFNVSTDCCILIDTIYSKKNGSELSRVIAPFRKILYFITNWDTIFINHFKSNVNKLLDYEINRDRTPVELEKLKDEYKKLSMISVPAKFYIWIRILRMFQLKMPIMMG